jgi:hypothetical protein
MRTTLRLLVAAVSCCHEEHRLQPVTRDDGNRATRQQARCKSEHFDTNFSTAVLKYLFLSQLLSSAFAPAKRFQRTRLCNELHIQTDRGINERTQSKKKTKEKASVRQKNPRNQRISKSLTNSRTFSSMPLGVSSSATSAPTGVVDCASNEADVADEAPFNDVGTARRDCCDCA